MKIKANLILPSSLELQKMTGLNANGKAQKYIDSFILYRSEPYLPGKHLFTPHANKIGGGQVIWNTPDANYLYEGKLMVDPKTLKGAFYSPNYGYWSRPHTQKIMDPKNRDLAYHGGGLRNKKWFDNFINDKMDELVKGVQITVNGGK